jgi:ankyrin repeat protein
MTIEETFEAIFHGDVEKLRALREIGGEEFAKQRTETERWNLLHMALLAPDRRTHIAVLEYLVQVGTDVDARDRSGYAPLHFAARGKYAEAMKLLLDHGASIDPANKDGITPLRQTLLSGPWSIAATELLLSRGANPEARMKNGNTVREFARQISHGPNKAFEDLFEKYK